MDIIYPPPYRVAFLWEDISVDLSIEEITDSFIKSVIPHEFPRVDGPTLEDMGLGVREITFRCYFADTLEETPFQDQVKLLKALQKLYSYKKPVTLVHPIYGSLKGAIDLVEIKHDATAMATCDVRFIEDRSPVYPKPPKFDNPLITPPGEIWEEIEKSLWETIRDAINDFIDSFKSFLAEAWDFVTYYTDMLSDAFDEVVGLVGEIRSVFEQIDYYFRQINNLLYGYIGDVIDIYEDFNNLINLPDIIAKKIARATTMHYARISNSLISISDDPVRYITQYNRIATENRTKVILDPQGETVREKTNKAIMQLDDTIRVAYLAKEVSKIYAADEQKRDIYKERENNPAWNVLGEYTPVEAPNILTLQDIEQSLFMVRSQIQQVIDSLRAEETIFIIGSQMPTPFTDGESVYFQTSKSEGVFISVSYDLPLWLPQEVLWDTDILDSTDWYSFQLNNGTPEKGETVIGIQSGLTMTISEIYGGYISYSKESINKLTDIALDLQKQAIHIKIESEKVIIRNISHDTHLVRVCTNNYLPFGYITRIFAINPQVWNPNSCRGYMKLYAQQR